MSGSTIGGVVGGVIGFYVGGAQGAQVGWMIGSAVGGYVDPDVIKGQRLRDAQVQTSAEGVPRPIIYGTAVVAGNIIQSGILQEHEEEERTGKGGPVQEKFSYTLDYAVRVCEGPVGGITRIWRNDKLVYDMRDPTDWPDDAENIMAMAADTGKFASKITIYLGTETQEPDPTLEALPTSRGGGIGNVPAYRGTCYVVFAGDDLTDLGGAVPQYRFEVSHCATEAPSWTTAPLWFAVGGTEGSYAQSRGGAEDWDADLQETSSFSANFVRVVTGNHKILLLSSAAGVCSSDSGATWTDLVGLPPGQVINGGLFALDASQRSGVFILFHNNGYISRSYDGINFSYDNFPILGNTAAVVQLSSSSFGLASTQLLAFGMKASSSSDLGITWELINGGDFLFDAVHGATSAAASGSTVLVGGTGGKLAFSGDSGASWTDYSASPFADTNPDADITDVICGVNFVVRNEAGEVAYGSAGAVVPVAGFTLVPSGNNTGHAEGSNYLLGGAAGEIAYSDSGQSWTILDNPFDDTSTAVRGIAGPGPLYGQALPDSPSWIVTDDGTIEGSTTGTLSLCTAELSDIVADICERVGLLASQIDVSQLTDEVRGFVIGRQLPAADAIRSLQQGYFFDFPEWDLKLRGIKRGGDTLFDITDDDLIQSDDDEDTRAQAVEFPRKINLITSDIAADYNPTKQTAERRTDNVKAVGEATIELPLALSRDESAQIVDKMLRVAWTEAEGRWQRELPEEFSQLVPSDCFTFNGKRLRAERCEYGDGSVKVEAVRDRASAYTSNATGGDIVRPTPPVSTLRGPTKFVAMNLPRLRTQDTSAGLYVAACGLLPGWIGCDLQLSVDGGLTYQSVLTMRAEATFGKLLLPCTASSEPITASIWPHGELESVTTAQLAARQNAFAITSAGVAEVGQFQTAEEGEPNQYELTDTLRGQLGTVAASHSVGDDFLLLDGAVYFLPLDVSLSGQTLLFRPVSIGTVPANNATYPVVFQPQFTGQQTVDFLETNDGEVIRTDTGAYIQVTA